MTSRSEITIAARDSGTIGNIQRDAVRLLVVQALRLGATVVYNELVPAGTIVVIEQPPLAMVLRGRTPNVAVFNECDRPRTDIWPTCRSEDGLGLERFRPPSV